MSDSHGGHATPSFRVGELTWAVESDDATIVAEVTDLYRACRRARHGAPAVTFSIVGAEGERAGAVRVCRNGAVVRDRLSRDLAVAYVVWALNGEFVAHADGAVLLHAGAVASTGSAIVVSGAEGAGKSTLTAALVRAGFEYVTDEVVALDDVTGDIAPYPKPIVLERGSWPLFGELGAPTTSRGHDDDQWLVAAHRIGPGRVASGSCRARLLVFPRYDPHASFEAAPMARAEAVIAIATESFNIRGRSPGALDVVARLVRACACYSIAYADAHEAASVVVQLFADAVP
jgi:hypothetical protein